MVLDFAAQTQNFQLVPADSSETGTNIYLSQLSIHFRKKAKVFLLDVTIRGVCVMSMCVLIHTPHVSGSTLYLPKHVTCLFFYTHFRTSVMGKVLSMGNIKINDVNCCMFSLIWHTECQYSNGGSFTFVTEFNVSMSQILMFGCSDGQLTLCFSLTRTLKYKKGPNITVPFHSHSI